MAGTFNVNVYVGVSYAPKHGNPVCLSDETASLSIPGKTMDYVKKSAETMLPEIMEQALAQAVASAEEAYGEHMAEGDGPLFDANLGEKIADRLGNG